MVENDESGEANGLSPEDTVAAKAAEDAAAKVAEDAAATKAAADAKVKEDADAKAAKDVKDGKPAKGEASETDDAPDAYEDFILPDGMELDKAAMEKFQPLAKELNLTQSAAQKLVDFQTAQAQVAADAAQSDWDDTLAGWIKVSEADKEIGGAKFDENLAIAKVGMKAFGTPELAALVENDSTGIGNNVEFLRFAFRVGNAVKEAKLHVGAYDGTKTPVTAADKLFPNQGKKTT